MTRIRLVVAILSTILASSSRLALTLSAVRSCVVSILLIVSSTAGAETIAIKAGRLLDTEKGTVSTNQVILVEGALIKAIGPELTIPAGASVVDLSKATVLPGLFDCHTHLCTNLGHPAGDRPRDFYEASFLATTVNTTGYRALVGASNALAMLEAGFTTVRDVGNAGNYADTDLRRAIEEGLLLGPTVLNAGRIIAPTGGQLAPRVPPHWRELFGIEGTDYTGTLRPDRPGLGEPEYFFADTKEELRKAVRENVLYGALVIKLVVDDQPYIYSVDEIRTVVQEAGRAGLKVCAHSMSDAGARNAAEAGVASIEHAFFVNDETLLLMKRNRVVLVGTDFSREAGKAVGLPPAMYERILQRLKRAYKARVSMAFGTDISAQPAGMSRGALAAAYADVYKEAGIPAHEVLRMMTTGAARLLGVEGRRGSLKPGLAADIIATAENPLDDIAAIKNVVFVMKDGKVVRR